MESLSSIFNSFILILPVIAVVAGGFAVFVFGFKNPSEPKKFNQKSNDSGTKKQQKRNQVRRKDSLAALLKNQQNTSGKQKLTAAAATTISPPSSSQQKKINSKTVTNRKHEVVNKKTSALTVAVKLVETKKKKNSDSANLTKSKPATTSQIINGAPPSVITPNTHKRIKSSAEKKPIDFDDGSWLTVPTKVIKKKNKEDSVNNNSNINSGPSKVDKLNDKSGAAAGGIAGLINTANSSGKTVSGTAGHQLSSPKLNQKTLKDQANKVKKEAELAEIKIPITKVVKEPPVVHHISIDDIPKIQSKIGFEFIINRKTIIDDPINDKKKFNSNLSSVEKIDNIKDVDDAWKVLKD